MNSFLTDWQQRQLIQDCTAVDDLHQHLNSAMRTVYAGFDPTADSLHVGSLLPLLALRRAQIQGHRPIVLVGGGTGLIGDPSGKAGERTLNNEETVALWVERLKNQVARFVDFDQGAHSALIADNYQWISKLDVIAFLRDIGKRFPLGSMLAKESVKSRLDRAGEGISFTEFSYMILQAYDFLELQKRHDCTIQIGGSDQWGNITAGIDLIRRVTSHTAYGITLPLVTKSDGSKFGKTESGTIWLDPNRTSAYDMYQFWLNTADQDVIRFLQYFTFLAPEHIQQLQQSMQQQPEKRNGQKALACEVVQLVHGDSALQQAQTITEAFFSGRVHTLKKEALKQAFQGAPQSKLSGAQLDQPIIDALITAQLATSKSQARQLINSKAVSINGALVDRLESRLRDFQPLHESVYLLRKGKKNYHLFTLVQP